ncbi:hypothetical protein BC940DRAFT_332515 [Gongronella butleri]|nr:hypothetical protein BC940DRAFT_332515 [Gongronella butleri]
MRPTDQQPEHAPLEKAPAPKPKKKSKYWHQRDSLAKRNRLLVGKEGSRRRQRWNNNHLLEHPFAILYEDDLILPGYSDLAASSPFWSQPEIVALMEDDELLQMMQSFHQEAVHVNSSMLPRHALRSLRKRHVPHSLVTDFEQQLVDFLNVTTTVDDPNEDVMSIDCLFDPYEGDNVMDDNDDDLYVDLVAPECLIWEVDNPFVRYVLHVMCQYYGLDSFTDHQEDTGACVVVLHPDHQLDPTAIYRMPGTSFFNALF